MFAQGERILRTGLTGGQLYVILEEKRSFGSTARTSRFGPGEFFGEIGVLLDEPPNADVEAATLLHASRFPGRRSSRSDRVSR